MNFGPTSAQTYLGDNFISFGLVPAWAQSQIGSGSTTFTMKGGATIADFGSFYYFFGITAGGVGFNFVELSFDPLKVTSGPTILDMGNLKTTGDLTGFSIAHEFERAADRTAGLSSFTTNIKFSNPVPGISSSGSLILGCLMLARRKRRSS